MIRKIKYQGKDYPLRISYKALKGVIGDLGREFNSDAAVFDFEGAESLLFHAIVQGCLFSGQEMDLKREDMENVLDESMQDFIAAFTDFSLPPNPGDQVEG